jgi:hypothetical protein
VAWFLNPALTNFRNTVNAAFPKRDKTSDGTVGDERHQAGISDHNPDADSSVDAWDMDVEVNGPGKVYAADVERLKVLTFQPHESAQYWIHDGQIATRESGWKRKTYFGVNRHDKHVHFNTRSAFENSTAPWIIGGAVSIDDVVKGFHRVADIAANRTDATGRQIADDLYVIISKALADEFTALHAALDAMVPVVAPGSVTEELIRRVVREEIDKTGLGGS